MFVPDNDHPVVTDTLEALIVTVCGGLVGIIGIVGG
jgi:hypothetical protein